jgi:hypothetical protein
MADRDLNLQLKLTKEQARRDLAEFGQEAQAQITNDMSQFQAAENAKAGVARNARTQRTRDQQAALQAEVDAAIAAEEQKVKAARAADEYRRYTIKLLWADQQRAAQDAVVIAKESGSQILAIESNKQAAAAQTAQAQRQQAAEQMSQSREMVLASTQAAQARRQQAAQQISQGRELALASTQSQRQLAALEGETAQASQQRSIVTRSAMEMEIAEASELGQAYVRVRMVQETQTQSMKQIGGTIAQAMKPGKNAVDNTKSSVENLGKAFVALQAVSQIGAMIQSAMDAVVQSAAKAREHIKGLVEEMEAARTASKELAALRGEKATAQFTADMAREAAAAGLDVEAYNQVQLGFQAQAGQFIGEEEATPDELAKQGKRISGNQAKDLQKDVGSYAVGARGLSADNASKLLGTVISKGEAGATNDEIMTEYAQIMKIAELAPGRTSEIVGQLSELGMESVGPTGDLKNLKEAAYIGRVMAQRNPAESATYGRALFRGLREIGMNEKGQMEELGITKDMDVMQQLDQIDKKAQAHVAAGGKENEVYQKYFPEIREFGAIRTAVNEGIRGGGFQRAMAEAESIDAGTVKRDIAEYRGGEEGVSARGRSQEIAEKRQNASFYVPLRRIQQEQRNLMLQSHELEQTETPGEAFMTWQAEKRGYGTREEQQLKKRTAYDLNTKLMATKQGREWLTREFGHDRVGGGREQGRIAPNADERDMARGAQMAQKIHDELVKANQQRAHANQQRERAMEHRDAPVPRVVPPQVHGGVRMGG